MRLPAAGGSSEYLQARKQDQRGDTRPAEHVIAIAHIGESTPLVPEPPRTPRRH